MAGAFEGNEAFCSGGRRPALFVAARSASALAEELLPPELASVWRAYTGRETVREAQREACVKMIGEVGKIAGAERAARLSAAVLAEAAENG